jgi:hypothetical protein
VAGRKELPAAAALCKNSRRFILGMGVLLTHHLRFDFWQPDIIHITVIDCHGSARVSGDFAR